MAIKNTNTSPLLKEGANITLTQSGQVITIAANDTTNAPGGSDTQVQFNDGGNFGGDAGLTYNKTTNVLGVESIDFAQTPAAATAERRLNWDQDEGSLVLTLKGGNVTIPLGHEVVTLVYNAEATTLTKGTVVYAFGAQGQRISVKRAVNTGDATSAQTIGIVAESIASGAEGWVMVQGMVRGLDTSAYVQGDALYLGATAGTYTKTKVYAPNHLVYVGIVVKVNASSGEIFVRCQNGYELDELHNVSAQSPSNNDGIFWNSSTNLWEKKSISTALGYTPAPASRMITINGTSQDLTTDRTWSVGTVLSVGLSAPTGFSVANSPVISSGTLALSFASGYSLPTTASQTNWDAAYNDKINSASVTGTTTKTLTLNQQDGGTVTASWTDLNTDAVTSVFGRTGAVTAQSGDYTTAQVTESGNLYYTDARARLAISETITGIDYNNSTGVFSLTTGYVIPTTTQETNWNEAYTNRITSLTTTGSSGAATLISNTLNIPNYTLAGLGGFANPMTTLGDVIYGAASGVATRLGGNTTTAKQYLSQTGTGTVSAAPSWSAIDGADVTGAALTKTDDTNVTLTLGGTPATSLLRAASLTLGWTGQLAVSRGGTGLSTLGTANQLLRVNSGATALEYWTPTYISSAITSLGGLTAATQTFATGTSGTDFNISSATSTHTFNIPTASGTNRGALSSADWTTFNGKENVLTFSSPLSRSTNTISIPAATGSVNGYLTSADWTTFNNKQNALTNPVTGTGASGQVAYFNGTTSITSESALLWDASNDKLTIGTNLSVTNTAIEQNDSNGLTINSSNASGSIKFRVAGDQRAVIDSSGRLGIGTASPADRLHVETSSEYQITYVRTGVGKRWALGIDTAGTYINNRTDSILPLYITNGGNVLIGTTTDPGYKLDVNGSGRFSGVNTNLYNSTIVASGDATYNPKITLASTTGYRWSLRNNDVGGNGEFTIRYEEGSLDTLNITRNGNLGLGTSSPSAIISGTETTLNVKGNVTNAVGSIVARSFGTTNATAIGIAAFDTINVTAIFTESNSPMVFYTNSTEKMTLTANGDLIIGSGADTGESLQVTGDAKISQALKVKNYSTLSQTVSGAMTILGHNVISDPVTANKVTVLNSGWYSSMIKMYYNEGITFHSSNTSYNAGDTFYLQGGTTNQVAQIKNDGQLKLNNYTTTTSFSGTTTGYLAFTNTGDVITKSPAQVLSDIGGGSGTIGGSTGSVDNAILRADGIGGSTVQSSAILIDDDANLQLGTSSVSSAQRSLSAAGSANDISLVLFSKNSGRIRLQSAGYINLTSTGDNNYRTQIEKDASAIANAVVYPLDIFTYGFTSFVSGIGTGLRFFVNTGTNNNEYGAAIDCICTDTTATSEDFDVTIKTMAAGLGPTERVRIKSTGQLQLNNYTSTSSFTGTEVGTLGYDASGNILSLGLTTTETKNTWTPAFSNSGATIVYATNGQVGYYVKHGSMVTVTFRLALAAGTSMTGNALTITGLPFTSVNTTNQEYICAIAWTSSVTNFVNAQGRISPNSSTITLLKTTAAAANSTTGMIGTDIGTGSVISGTITYFV